MDIPNNLSVREMVIIKLKEMIDHVSISDRCTICEAIHQLEQPSDKNLNGSIWMLIIFALIFGGFGENSLDLETVSKILNDSIAKAKEESK